MLVQTVPLMEALLTVFAAAIKRHKEESRVVYLAHRVITRWVKVGTHSEMKIR